MPIRDIKNDLETKVVLAQLINSDTTSVGAIIDTQGLDRGLLYTILSTSRTDGTYTPLIEEGDASNLSDASAVADANLIGTEAAAALSADTTDGTVLKSIGVIGTKRYLRLSIVSTSVTTGATIAVVAVYSKNELKV